MAQFSFFHLHVVLSYLLYSLSSFNIICLIKNWKYFSEVLARTQTHTNEYNIFIHIHVHANISIHKMCVCVHFFLDNVMFFHCGLGMIPVPASNHLFLGWLKKECIHFVQEIHIIVNVFVHMYVCIIVYVCYNRNWLQNVNTLLLCERDNTLLI